MNNQYLTKTELTRRWSQNLIDFYFSVPTMEKPNPRHKRGAPMQLYDIGRIRYIESTQAFQDDYEQVYKRKVAAIERAKKKRRNQ